MLAGLCGPLNSVAQVHQPASKPLPTPKELPSAGESPDVIAFRHIVASQATEAQKTQFLEVARTMRTAIAQAQRLHSIASGAAAAEDLSRSGTALRDAIYDAQHENYVLLKSLSDLQEAELKKLTTKLRKANEAVGKASDAANDEVSRRRPNLKRVSALTTALEKELLTMQSDQRNLAREMSVKRSLMEEDTGGAEEK